MEIERKYLIKEIPFSLEAYPYKELEQGYISTSPVIRIRKADEQYILTVKSSGLLERQEFELPMNETDYKRLLGKVDGNLVTKRRYIIPLTDTEGTTGDKEKDAGLKIELDVFEGLYQGLIYAEVEFEPMAGIECGDPLRLLVFGDPARRIKGFAFVTELKV